MKRLFISILALTLILLTGCAQTIKRVQYTFEGRNYMKMYPGEKKGFEELSVLRTFDEVYRKGKLNYLYNVTHINGQLVPDITHLVALEPGTYEITYDCHNYDRSNQAMKLEVKLKTGSCAVLSGGGYQKVRKSRCTGGNLTKGIAAAHKLCSPTGVDYERAVHSCSRPLRVVEEHCFVAYEKRKKRKVEEDLYYTNVDYFADGDAEFVTPLTAVSEQR